MHKPLLIVFGICCVALAVVGIFLPVLPTTPLLLLALACFAKSSERLHAWLLSHKNLGPFIKQWQETRSMSAKTKRYALITIVIGGSISVYSVETDMLRLVLLAVLIIPVVIILNIRTLE